jgi:hypothetical protein
MVLMLGQGCSRTDDAISAGRVIEIDRSQYSEELLALDRALLSLAQDSEQSADWLGNEGQIVADVRRSTNGDFVVAIGDFDRVLFVRSDSIGRISTRRKIGRRGRGPGEYLGIRAVCLTGDDSILTVDGPNRIAHTTSEGGLIGQSIVAGRGDVNALAGCSSSGAIAFTRLVSPKRTVVEIFDATGSQKGKTLSREIRPVTAEEPFATPLAAAAGEEIIVADPYSPQIDVYTSTGVHRDRIVLREDPPSAPEGAFVTLSAPAGGEGSRPARVSQPGTMASLPKRWPYFDIVVASENGRLWIRDYSNVMQDTERWTTLGPNQEARGRLALVPPAQDWRVRALRFTACCTLVEITNPEGEVSLRLIELPERFRSR